MMYKMNLFLRKIIYTLKAMLCYLKMIDFNDNSSEKCMSFVFDFEKGASNCFLGYLLQVAVEMDADKIYIQSFKPSIYISQKFSHVNNKTKFKSRLLKVSNPTYVFTDKRNANYNNSKIIYCDYNYFTRTNNKVLPYNANFYNLEKEVLSQVKFNNKKVAFYGSVCSTYDNIKFDMLNRNIVVDYLQKNKGKIECSLDLVVCDGTLGSKGHKMCFDEYLVRLSNIDFFICMPGIVMPFCGHVIECMKEGVIPILNYATMFEIPLVDMDNCLTFDTLDELKEKLNAIKNMSEQDIMKMKSNVIAYYENELSPRAFAKWLENCNNRETIVCNGEHLSVRLMTKGVS